jgi:hypothetical protein
MRFNQATRNDVSFIVELLANDKLGQSREQYEQPLPEEYYLTFDKLDRIHIKNLPQSRFERGIATELHTIPDVPRGN